MCLFRKKIYSESIRDQDGKMSFLVQRSFGKKVKWKIIGLVWWSEKPSYLNESVSRILELAWSGFVVVADGDEDRDVRVGGVTVATGCRELDGVLKIQDFLKDRKQEYFNIRVKLMVWFFYVFIWMNTFFEISINIWYDIYWCQYDCFFKRKY